MLGEGVVGGEELDKQLSFVIVTSMQFLPLVTLLAMPTYAGLWSQNCLKKEHVLWEDMIFWTTCL